MVKLQDMIVCLLNFLFTLIVKFLFVILYPFKGRAFLFENCANVVQGPAEDRRLITGLHSVCDITCKRCKTLIGWTYEKAYESSQKYKEGKFIVERIHLFMEENNNYDIDPPAGERRDHWRRRSMS